MSASINDWSGCPQLVVVNTELCNDEYNGDKQIYSNMFLLLFKQATLTIDQFIAAMVDGFGLDIVAKLMLAHGSDDCFVR